jgi:hypothetical protein
VRAGNRENGHNCAAAAELWAILLRWPVLRYKGVIDAIIGGIAMTRDFSKKLAVVACLLPLLGPPAVAQDDEDQPFDRTPQDCILASSIDETDATDDQNIIFYMRGQRAYRNHLPRKCPGLERENRISYKLTGTRRLCSTDTITVLEESVFGGGVGVGGFREGFTCRLGEFVPLSPAEIEELEARREEGGGFFGRRRPPGGRQPQQTVETSEVELPAPESGAEEPAAEAAPAPEAAPAESDN